MHSLTIFYLTCRECGNISPLRSSAKEALAAAVERGWTIFKSTGSVGQCDECAADLAEDIEREQQR